MNGSAGRARRNRGRTRRSAERREAKGLVCATCGCGHFRVVWTRPREDGTVVRRRRCRHCGRPKLTVERENEP